MQDNNNVLFEKYITPNLDTIKSLTKYYTFNPDDIADNYQNILIELFKYIHTYDNTKNLKTWLHVAIKRHCQDLYIKKKKEPLQRLMPNQGGMSFYYDTGEDYTVQLFADSLNHWERKILDYLMSGYNHIETAKLIGKSETFCYLRVKDIKLKFFRYFKPYNNVLVTRALNCPYLRAKTVRSDFKR